MSKKTVQTSAPTLQTLAAGLGVTVRRVSQLKTLGMDCSSLAAAEEWRKRKSASGEISVDELRKARFHLIEEQRRKIEIENQVRRGELVEARQQYEAGLALGHQLKTELLKFVSDVTPALQGLECVQIHRILRDGLHGILCRMSSDAAYSSPQLEALIEDFRKTHPPNWTNKPAITKP